MRYRLTAVPLAALGTAVVAARRAERARERRLALAAVVAGSLLTAWLPAGWVACAATDACFH
jgi:cytochrome c oxidase assembly factor CtaG